MAPLAGQSHTTVSHRTFGTPEKTSDLNTCRWIYLTDGGFLKGRINPEGPGQE
jgi:hypothetical protein